jgi:hypothetical protein
MPNPWVNLVRGDRLIRSTKWWARKNKWEKGLEEEEEQEQNNGPLVSIFRGIF